MLDYEQDINAIYAALLQAYGVNLFERTGNTYKFQTMHWWEFSALVENLPEGNTLMDFYGYYCRIKLHELPTETAADKKHWKAVDEIKESIRLDRPQQDQEQQEAWFDVKAREMKAGEK